MGLKANVSSVTLKQLMFATVVMKGHWLSMHLKGIVFPIHFVAPFDILILSELQDIHLQRIIICFYADYIAKILHSYAWYAAKACDWHLTDVTSMQRISQYV
jgi:hypothetical protein